MVDFGAVRAEMLLIRIVLARHREREQGAAVVAVRECDHRRAAGILARDLHRVLRRFGAGRKEQRLFWRAPGARRLSSSATRTYGSYIVT